jgi:RimJ/RimL family protein N-acetyltransferase
MSPNDNDLVPAPILATRRLIVRPMVATDMEDLAAILQDPVAMTAYEGPFSDEEVRRWLDRQLERYADDGFGLWALLARDTGQMIGD